MVKKTSRTNQDICTADYNPEGDSIEGEIMIEKAGKYFTFTVTVADREYGIGILKIKEIIGKVP